MRRGPWLMLAAALLGVAGPAEARRKPSPPPPLPTGTLIENVNGYTLDKAGALVRFNGLLIGDNGRVKQLLKQGDKREPVKFRTDAAGRMMLPGLIDDHGRVMELGRQLLEEARAAAGERQLRDNPVDREAALTRALVRLASLGITMVEDAGTALDDWLLYRRFGDEGRLSVRIYAMADGMEVLDHVAPLRPTPWLYGDRLVMRAVVLSPEDPAASPAVVDARLRNRISKASMAGVQTSVEAADAAAQAQALDAYAEMLPTYGRNRRYRIEARGVAAAIDPKQLNDMGIVAPSTRSNEASPLRNVQAAAQQGPSAQELSAQQALAAFTTRAAYGAFAEDRLGTLEPGKWADFILVDRDILAGAPVEAGQAQVLETWVGGKRVYVKAANSPVRSASKP